MNKPTPREIVKVLEHLKDTWMHDTTIEYLLEKYKELGEYLQ